MPGIKKKISKELARIKKGMQRIMKPKESQALPQLILQPYRNKKIF